MALPLDELIATVESGYDALMATLRRGIAAEQSRQGPDEDPVAGGGGDGR